VMGIRQDFLLSPAHAHLNLVGGIMFPVGIGITLLANHAYMAIPIIGSLIMLAAMALFVVIVLRTERSGTAV